MSFKLFYHILKIIHHILVMFSKMVNSVEDNSRPYKFRAFKFVRIKPSSRSRVPFPRSGHRIGADSANFYCFGGYNPVVPPQIEPEEEQIHYVNSFPLFQELWRFNYATKRWFRYPNGRTLPSELASNALLLHRNLLMVYLCVYGGTGSPFGFRCSNQLYFCLVNDENASMEEVKTSGQLPLPLYGQALIYDNGHLYTIGGTTGLSYTCDIHRLNIKTKVWEAIYIGQGLQDEPNGRYRHEVAFDGENIYILGGGTAETAYDFIHIPVFNLDTQRWYKKKTLEDGSKGVPPPRLCHGAVQIDTEKGIQVFLTGGHDGQRLFDDLWKLELNSLQWTCLSHCKLPVPMYFHAAAVSPEGRMCVFGGIFRNMTNDTTRSNNIYTAWLCIPKLSEICWEAIMHYYPHISACSKEQLIKIGLPRQFVNRLDS